MAIVSEKSVSKKNGFALLVAVIFMSVMLALGLSLASLGYKQVVLAQSAQESQYAFYAADAGLECLLYYDEHQAAFTGATSPPSVLCDEASSVVGYPTQGSASINGDQYDVYSYRFLLDSATTRPRCATVDVYKPKVTSNTTYMFSQGYDTSCATIADPQGARYVSRGISAFY